MRRLSAILFTCGVPWALIAWIAVFGGPSAAIEDLAAAIRTHRRLFEAFVQIPIMLLWTGQAVVGYAVWVRWLGIASGEFRSTRRFWLLTALHHLGWVFLAGVSFWDDPTILSSLILYYSAAVFIICVVAALAGSGGGNSGNSRNSGPKPVAA